MPSFSAVFLLSALAIHAAVPASASSTSSVTPKKQAWKPRHRSATGTALPVESEEGTGSWTKESTLPIERPSGSKRLSPSTPSSKTSPTRSFDAFQVVPETPSKRDASQEFPHDDEVLSTRDEEYDEDSYRLDGGWHSLVYGDGDPEKLLDELASMFTPGYEERFMMPAPGYSARDESKSNDT